jgi:type IV pilus assembly protein PilO
MAFNIREMSLPVQALLFLVLAVILIGVGLYAPFLPVKQKKAELDAAVQRVQALERDVGQLRDVRRRFAEFRSQMEAQQRELDSLRNIVPEEKEADEFIREVHAQATSANVAIRRMTAKPINVREGYAEMPFEIEVDGPYYAVLDFFTRLGRVSRIINVGDLSFTGLAEARGKKYPVRPGTTVTGTFMATTFFTKGADQLPTKQPAKAAAPAKR